MKDLVIVGDSFCASDRGWPERLANMLGLNLVCRGEPGEHWWPNAKFLKDYNLSNTDCVVVCHTYAQRIPSENKLGKYNWGNLDLTNETQLAISLYFKYIQSIEFMNYAQRIWFKDLNNICADVKLINLHSFVDSLHNSDILSGINVTTPLIEISQRENDHSMVKDLRLNHMNDQNNTELATQLKDIILNCNEGEVELDLDKFYK